MADLVRSTPYPTTVEQQVNGDVKLFSAGQHFATLRATDGYLCLPTGLTAASGLSVDGLGRVLSVGI